jgi:hypothetical protein
MLARTSFGVTKLLKLLYEILGELADAHDQWALVVFGRVAIELTDSIDRRLAIGGQLLINFPQTVARLPATWPPLVA